MRTIRVENISKSFGDNLVLDNMSFQVDNGSFLALLGPSGCGKTTLLRIISGLEYPDEGRIWVGDQELTSIPTEKRNVGMVFQNYAMIAHMTVFNNIAYGLKIRRCSKNEINIRVSEIIKLVGLTGMEDRKVTKLSGGQQQRVALARALVIKPHILLLDEPMAALDRRIRTEMQYEIRRIQQEVGITTVFVTHDQEEAMTMSDNIVLMNKGTVEQLSTPENLYNHPKSLFTSEFLGKANTLYGQAEFRDGKWFVNGDGWSFETSNSKELDDGKLISIVIRGEHFLPNDKPVENANLLTVKNKVFTGTVCKVACTLGSDEVDLICINTVAAKMSVGQQLYVTINPDLVHCFSEQEP